MKFTVIPGKNGFNTYECTVCGRRFGGSTPPLRCMHGQGSNTATEGQKMEVEAYMRD